MYLFFSSVITVYYPASFLAETREIYLFYTAQHQMDGFTLAQNIL